MGAQVIRLPGTAAASLGRRKGERREEEGSAASNLLTFLLYFFISLFISGHIGLLFSKSVKLFHDGRQK